MRRFSGFVHPATSFPTLYEPRISSTFRPAQISIIYFPFALDHERRPDDDSRMLRPAVLAAVLVAACHHGTPPSGAQLRLGYFPNLTHAAGLVAIERGELQRALAPVAVETKPFNAGPEAIEALFAGALDATYVGSMPALNGYLRSRGKALSVVAGAAAGGAALVVRAEAGIRGPEDLHGKRLATPQLGNTQDVALRVYLKQHGLAPRERGGDVQVLPMANPDILSLMKRGQLDGAWVPEPWTTRLVHEANARILVEDKDFWPGTATALLVVSSAYLQAHPEIVRALVTVNADSVAFIRAHPAEARALAAQAIVKGGGKPLPPDELAESMARIDFTTDPHEPRIVELAARAHELGYLPTPDLAGLVDRRFLADGGAP
jgi:NitT/TauT family transport system substrate-binding protein